MPDFRMATFQRKADSRSSKPTGTTGHYDNCYLKSLADLVLQSDKPGATSAIVIVIAGTASNRQVADSAVFRVRFREIG